MSNRLITPKTTVADLLADYPQLESLLIEAAPVFVKLKNPLLRRTIAKVTSIAQAASIANLPVGELVNKLRTAVGQSATATLETKSTTYKTQRPGWFNQAVVVETIDIAAMLDNGEQPVHTVLARLNGLAEGEIVAIKAGFLPAPLLDKSLSLGFQHWVSAEELGGFTVYFHR